MAKILAELVPKMTRQYFRTYVFFYSFVGIFRDFLYFVIVIPASFPFSIGVYLNSYCFMMVFLEAANRVCINTLYLISAFLKIHLRILVKANIFHYPYQIQGNHKA